MKKILPRKGLWKKTASPHFLFLKGAAAKAVKIFSHRFFLQYLVIMLPFSIFIFLGLWFGGSPGAVPGNTPRSHEEVQLPISRTARSQTTGGPGEHSVCRALHLHVQTPTQTRLFPAKQPSIPRPCQGFLSLTSGFLCPRAERSGDFIQRV